jgi:hypothetical protein
MTSIIMFINIQGKTVVKLRNGEAESRRNTELQETALSSNVSHFLDLWNPKNSSSNHIWLLPLQYSEDSAPCNYGVKYLILSLSWAGDQEIPIIIDSKDSLPWSQKSTNGPYSSHLNPVLTNFLPTILFSIILSPTHTFPKWSPSLTLPTKLVYAFLVYQCVSHVSPM